MLVKRVLLSATRSAAFEMFIGLLERVSGERPDLLRVLTYHRVDEPEAHPTLCPSLISASPADFEQQMAYVADNYTVVSMAEVLDVYQRGTSLPPRSVLLTFDDAYCDFAEHAWPVMKRYGLPVTLFVPTGFPDQPRRTFWWDRLYHAMNKPKSRRLVDTPLGLLPLTTPAQRGDAFRVLRDYMKTLGHQEAMWLVDRVCRQVGSRLPEHYVLNWDSLRSLAREGVTLAPHTRTHPLLNRVPPAVAREEVVGSLRDLERKIGRVPPVFAYPSGACDDEVTGILDKEGFVLAFATRRGINDLRQTDRLRLRRINVGRRTTEPILRAQLLPWSRYLSWS